MSTLTQRLRANAIGYYPAEAATRILIHGANGRLLDKLSAAIVDDPGRFATAYVNWDLAVEISRPFSGSERRLIDLAASLAGTDHLVDANDVFSSLDDLNSRVVLDAIAHCLRITQ